MSFIGPCRLELSPARSCQHPLFSWVLCTTTWSGINYPPCIYMAHTCSKYKVCSKSQLGSRPGMQLLQKRLGSRCSHSWNDLRKINSGMLSHWTTNPFIYYIHTTVHIPNVFHLNKLKSWHIVLSSCYRLQGRLSLINTIQYYRLSSKPLGCASWPLAFLPIL